MTKSIFLSVTCEPFFIAREILVQLTGPLVTMSFEPLEGKLAFFKRALYINHYNSILLWALEMEALLGGLSPIRMSDGRINSGVIHSALFLFMITAFFYSFSI